MEDINATIDGMFSGKLGNVIKAMARIAHEHDVELKVDTAKGVSVIIPRASASLAHA